MASTRRKAAYTAAAAAVAADGPAGFGSRVASIPRLVRDVLAGDYDGMTRGRLAMMVLALLYIVSPIDLLPEALMTTQVWLDDAAVAAWLVAATFGATTAYRGMGEQPDRPRRPGEPERGPRGSPLIGASATQVPRCRPADGHRPGEPLRGPRRT